nr:non-ribosomal peptide synthetase [Kibdelosporangium sp. MJ126-NF4]CEL17995.1 Siderophore biosynthesis non-ribosomal peptide synthetase modules [Kibdelosporangium sp. MJ126-NF4]CTQ90777.1 Siderophore biosynthesis non-ribosomal peptide synthetase modules [Kibdelosporangium sp. MJ126-NF4]
MTAQDDVLEARKRELRRLLLQESGFADTTREVISPRTATDAVPLTSAQQRMLFLQRLEPDSGAYNLSAAVRFKGRLDVDAVRHSVQRLVARHEILRTTYRDDEQHVTASATINMTEVDVLDPAALPGLITDLARIPFELERDLPIRATLVRLAADEHLLVLVVHHIALDDESWGLVLADLAEGYRASVQDLPPTPPPRLQYADYAAWQADNPSAATDLDYWRGRLDPLPPAVPLPTDFRRPDTATLDGIRRSHVLPAELSARIRAVARDEGVTVNMVLLAVFKTLLYRYTGATDIAVGTPVVHRDRAELEGVVGNFGNTLVLRTEISGNPVFRDLLDRVRTTCTEAYSHQDLPFDQLVEALRPPRVAGRAVFTDVMFSFVTNPPYRAELPGVVMTEEPAWNQTARFDLVFEVMDAPDGMAFTVTARSDLFTEATADRMLGHLATLADAVTSDPGRRLSALALLTADEERRILTQWSRTRTESEVDRPLSRMFEEQVRRTPDAEAVVFAGERVSFAELNQRANRLARKLVSLGVGPERTVGVHLERSVEMVVGLLAILKAGGAFVPLEPSWPSLRIDDVVRRARLAAVLSKAVPGKTAADFGVPVVDMSQSFGEYDPDDPDYGPRMENPAYVIFTSGSTGTPKGAVIRHQSICNRLPWQVGLLGLTASDAVLFKAPLGFDISVNEIFLPLVSGARLVIAEPGAEADIPVLLDLIAAERVSFIYIVASMLDVMLDHPALPDAAKALRHVWCGGEALTPGLYARFRERMDATMYHGYGPAETTVGVSCRVFPPEETSTTISIGRPNPNARIYLLDPGLALVPAGVPGEVHIGGPPLARGYVNDAALTAARFVPDPFSGIPGARLYRTGDLARYQPDGQLEFLGRTDNQVKLRGMRIELEEIEAVAQRHPGVQQAVAVIKDGAHLAVYCSGASGTRPTVADLSGWLAARLPAAMVPRYCTVLDELPLLNSGKADRAALAALRETDVVHAPHVDPRDRVERDIAEVWRRVLGTDRVGVHDNFFDLGGHSLLLMKVQAELAMDVSVRDLFTHTTIASLAGHLNQGAGPSHLDSVRARAERARLAMAHRARRT